MPRRVVVYEDKDRPPLKGVRPRGEGNEDRQDFRLPDYLLVAAVGPLANYAVVDPAAKELDSPLPRENARTHADRR